MAEEVERFVIEKSGKPLSRTGSVTVIQRFGSSLSLNFHLHALVLDGVMTRKTTGREKFEAIAAPSDDDVARLVKRIGDRLLRYLEKQNYLTREGLSEEPPTDKLFDESPWLAEATLASTRYLIAHGPRAGQPLRRVGDSETSEFAASSKSTRCAEYRGFSLHANTVARDEKAARRLVSYVARPPIAHGKLTECENGDLLFEMKRTFSNGVKAIRFSPYELLEKLTTLIAKPRAHLIRYSGVFGRAARNRKNVVVKKIDQPKNENDDNKSVAQSITNNKFSWAALLKRTFEIDLSKCALCGGPTRFLGTVQSKSATEKILAHLGLAAHPPPRGHGDNGWGLLSQSISPADLDTHTEHFDGQFSDFGV